MAGSPASSVAADPAAGVDLEWPEHGVLVLNNWRVLHGRLAVPASTDRVMVWGYVTKYIADMRYRLLRQRQLERVLGAEWTTRLPDEVLADLWDLAAPP